jgi:hypothetical protein
MVDTKRSDAFQASSQHFLNLHDFRAQIVYKTILEGHNLTKVLKTNQSHPFWEMRYGENMGK